MPHMTNKGPGTNTLDKWQEKTSDKVSQTAGMASSQIATMNNASAYMQQSCLSFQAVFEEDSLTHFHLEGRKNLRNGVFTHDPVIVKV